MSQKDPSTNEPKSWAGVPLDHWDRIFAPHIVEFAATHWAFSDEIGEQIRIAFGNGGPFTDINGARDKPQYTHAVTLPRTAAIAMAQLLIQHLAEVKSSADV